MQVLVIRPGALGDVILTLPALQALQEAWPDAVTEMMGRPAVLEWLLGRSVVQRVQSFDRSELATLFAEGAGPGLWLRRYLKGFGLLLSYVGPAAQSFARNLARLAPGHVITWDPRPPPGMRRHLSEYLQTPLQQLGVPTSAQPPRVRPTVEDEQGAAAWWSEQRLINQRVAAIHPGSGSPAKNWPAERFAELAQHLQHEHGLHPLVLGASVDESVVGMVVRDLADQPHTVLHNAPLSSLAAILVRCSIYIGNDSGISHLAAAVGVPTVALFGPSDPAVWAPRGPSVRVVSGAAQCGPCEVEQRRACQHRACLQAISTQDVLVAVRQAMSDSTG